MEAMHSEKEMIRSEEEIRQQLAKILVEDFGVPKDNIHDDATFRASFGLDSLDIVDFILLVQKDFGYKAPTESYSNLATFADLVKFVMLKVGG